jgi:ABC-type Fe2+-enterobactin transport system substrate-binding protein
MHDQRHAAERPADWTAAFAALPLEAAPPDAWRAVQRRVETDRTQVSPMWWAAAAVAGLVLAIAMPWHDRVAPVPSPTAATVAAPGRIAPEQLELRRLYAESEHLEALRQLAQDDRVASGTAAALASDLDARIAAIDAALMQPDLPIERELELWQARVRTLGAAAGFEGTRRWLAARGTRYDAALVRVD